VEACQVGHADQKNNGDGSKEDPEDAAGIAYDVVDQKGRIGCAFLVGLWKSEGELPGDRGQLLPGLNQ
jgi:hypothetical protein